MPFNRPSLDTLIERAIADIDSRLPGADARLRRSNLNVLARVLAAAAHGLHGHLVWNSRQFLPDTAEAENLDRLAALWLNVPRKAAAFARGEVTFAGLNGAVIPAGTVLMRSDGAEFATDEDATIVGGTATATVTAVVAGEAGNTDAGAMLALTSPIAGVTGAATVGGGGLTGGTETESDDSLRARIIARMSEPPHGGAKHDYIAWALEVSGVTRAWVNDTWLGDGSLTVLFVRDNDPDIFPDAQAIATVQAYIDERRPVTAKPVVIAPTPKTLNLQIQISPDTAAVRAAVEESLKDMLTRDAAPGATIYVSRIREAISIAAGESHHALLSPTSDVTHAAHEMAKLGTITWS